MPLAGVALRACQCALGGGGLESMLACPWRDGDTLNKQGQIMKRCQNSAGKVSTISLARAAIDGRTEGGSGNRLGYPVRQGSYERLHSGVSTPSQKEIVRESCGRRMLLQTNLAGYRNPHIETYLPRGLPGHLKQSFIFLKPPLLMVPRPYRPTLPNVLIVLPH